MVYTGIYALVTLPNLTLLRFQCSLVKISDIHLSYLNNEERTQAFENFTTETLDTINPRVVLVSGDLTDGRGKGIYDVGQNDEEWEAYNRIVTKSKVQEKTVWLDIRGNHGKIV